MEENAMQAQPAIFTATIQIKRAATGNVEEYQITGTALPEAPAEVEQPKETE